MLLLVALLAALGSPVPATPAAPVVSSVTAPVQHGEGSFWDHRTQMLYFVDISSELLNRYDPATGKVTSIHLEGGGVTLVVPVAGSLDEFVVTRGHEVLLVKWDGLSSQPQKVDVVTSVEANKPGNRFNDGKADSTGRMWLGTMGPEPTVGNVVPDQGSLYSMDVNSAQAVKHLGPVTVSNGLVWSDDDKILYYIDSPTELVEAFNYDIFSGDISNRRTIFNLTENNVPGVPDGMTIDADGNLWVAVFNGAKVININPVTKQLIRSVDFPVDRVTDVAFGGPDFMTLYATTSRVGMTEEEVAKQPLAGTVFEVRGLGVRGLPGNFAARPCVPA